LVFRGFWGDNFLFLIFNSSLKKINGEKFNIQDTTPFLRMIAHAAALVFLAAAAGTGIVSTGLHTNTF
jgi:hypothetical protein